MKGRWCSARAVAILCAILATAGGAWSPTCIAGDLDGDLDDTARVIGGFQSSLNKFGKAEDPLWRSYTREAGAFWNEYERRIGRPMRQWGCRELNRDDGATVFYPFSGPDLPAAFQLFPDADRYVLVSMQKAEAPPRLGSFSKEELEDYLAVLRKAWRFYGVLGFFRTDDLDADAKALARPIGVTGALMGFAVRLGFEIEAVDPIQLDLDANQITLRNRTPERSDTWDSVRFTLRKDNRKVHVDYVRIDLSDASLERVPGPGIWIDRMAENPTILKAASHHPQEPEFSIFRNSVLRKAQVIVQDETGIDYGALAEEFSVRLYGKFTRPNPSFDQNMQRALAAAYRKDAGVKPLPFRSGYEKDAGSAMQVAIRHTNTAQMPRRCVQAGSSAGR